MTTTDHVENLLEVELVGDRDTFLKVKETLSRIGIASKKNNTLYQSCHILHKRGRYYIVHFKEMFALDGRKTDISESDLQRRDTIAVLLEEWNLVRILNLADDFTPIKGIKILSHREKGDWNLVTKYSIGNNKKR